MEAKKNKAAGIVIAAFGVLLFGVLVLALILSATQCTTHQHTEGPMPAISASCTEDGKTEGVQCTTCGKILVAQDVIPAAGHQYGEPVVEKEPTESEYGLATSVCSVCGAKKTEKLDPIGTMDPTEPSDDPTEPSQDPTEPDEETDNPGGNTGTDGNNNPGGNTGTDGNNNPGGNTGTDGNNNPGGNAGGNGGGNAGGNGGGNAGGNGGGNAGNGGAAAPTKPAGYGICMADVLNVRKGPGKNYGVAGVVKELDRLTIYDTKDGWLKIDGGWVSADYVYVDGQKGPDGSAKGSVKGMLVNIRKGPGTKYGVNKVVNTGYEVEIFYSAEFEGRIWGCTKEGWICMDYVEISDCQHKSVEYQHDGVEHWGICNLCRQETARQEHQLQNHICSVCKYDATPSAEGLEFTLSSDRSFYIVTKYAGTADYVSIPATHSEKPVAQIGKDAFKGSKLFGIEIPSGITQISGNPFAGCTNLISISVDPANTAFASSGNCVLEKQSGKLIIGCKGSQIPADDSVTAIARDAFAGCHIASVTIPASVTTIESGAFSGCEKLTSATFSNATGWSTTDSADASAVPAAVDVTDAQKNAENLVKDLAGHTWTHS